MVILSDYTEEEESKPQQPQTPSQSFSGTVDPSKPLGFIQSALELVAKFCPDFFGSDSSENEIAKVVKSVKKKVEVDAAAKKKLASDAAAAKKKVEAKVKVAPSVKKEESCSSSSTVDEEKKEESKYRVPNKANGLDLENYSWGQSLQEVNVTVPVPPGTISKLIVCKIKKNHLKVGLKGQPPIIDGELYKPVRPDDCFWSLEDNKAVSILLTKHDQMDWWRAVVKGEPEIDTLHHLLDADDFTAAPTTAGVRDARAMARMPADVKEYPNSYQFIIDMPGLKSSDIKVQIEDENVLVISGERKRIEDEKEGGVKYLKMERRVGKFMRKFALPENANVEAITAVCQDGVLTVTVEKLPPPEPKKPKTIEVKVA